MRKLNMLNKSMALLLSSCFCLSVLADPITLKVQCVSNDNDKYSYALLKLALSYSNNKYQTVVDPAYEKTLARTINEVESGITDIMWTATDREKEKIILPIRIPLYKGLLATGYYW